LLLWPDTARGKVSNRIRIVKQKNGAPKPLGAGPLGSEFRHTTALVIDTEQLALIPPRLA